jgi:hypothetical protein
MTMANKTSKKSPKKCYNTFSCIASVLIIIFMVGAVLWDLCVSKPVIYESIEEIKTEVQVINQKIDNHYQIVNDINDLRKLRIEIEQDSIENIIEK